MEVETYVRFRCMLNSMVYEVDKFGRKIWNFIHKFFINHQRPFSMNTMWNIIEKYNKCYHEAAGGGLFI